MKIMYEAMYNHYARHYTDETHISAQHANQLLRNGFLGYVNVILTHLEVLHLDRQHYLANAMHMIDKFIRREHYLEYSGCLPLKNSILKHMRRRLRCIRRQLKREARTFRNSYA